MHHSNTFNQNGVLTAKPGSIDTANGSTSLFNNVAVPNANYLYYTDNIGNIYVCDNSSSTPSCSEAEPASSFLPSGYSVNNGQESLFFIGNTLYANAVLTSTSGYTNYLFPFTINSNNGSLNLDSGNEIIGGTGTSATSYFGSIYTFYPYNYIFSSSVATIGNTIEAYSVDPSTGLVAVVSNPVSSTEVENAGDSYLGDGDIITLDYSNSVGTLNNYLENNGSFNLDGSTALNGIEMLDGVLNFPFTALSQVNPDENYMTSVYCNEFENVCNNEPPITAYIDGYAGTANAKSIYGIQIGSNSLSAMNSGNAIASYITGTSTVVNYAVEIYEFFPSGYPSAEENGIASEMNAYSF